MTLKPSSANITSLVSLCGLGSFSLSLGSFMAVPDFQVEYRLCLNGQTVPVETKHMVLVDPLNLAGTNSLDLPDSTDVNLVSFKATGDMHWLCKTLQLPVGGDDKYCQCRWWAHNSARIPLLMEIKQAIKNLKEKKKARQPTDHQCLILLEIRGMLLYVKNSSTAVTLGLTKEPGTLTVPHPDLDPLLWFCTQLKKDIDQHLHSKPGKKADHQLLVEHTEPVEEVLEQLKAHPQCEMVHFVPSRVSFRIHKRSGAGKDVPVQGLNKWRKTEGGAKGSQDPFQKCLSMGLSVLDAPDDAPASPPPAAPDSEQ